MTTLASAVTPVVGLATAPVLAQSLGVEGRGAFSAALAPALVVGSVITLGLTEAMTFHVAKNPATAVKSLLQTLALTTALFLPAVVLVVFAAPVLAGGDKVLARLILIATVLCLPAVHLSLIRGVASGHQMWGLVTLEKVAGGLLRLGLIVGLALSGHLTVLSAVLVATLLPLLTAGVYWRAFVPVQSAGDVPRHLMRSLLSYGARSWVGSVAVMLLSRINQLLLTPLSSVEQVGLLAVAITIADVPVIFTTSVRDVLFGVSSATADIHQLARVSRLTVLLTLGGSLVIAGTLPLWLGPLFGEDFTGATWVTVLLLVSQLVGVPGLMMGAAASALGHPGMRSTAQVIALVVNVVAVVSLAPHLGALGAGVASLMDTTAVLVFSLFRLRKMTNVRRRDFFLVRPTDALFLAQRSSGFLRRRRVS